MFDACEVEPDVDLLEVDALLLRVGLRGGDDGLALRSLIIIRMG